MKLDFIKEQIQNVDRWTTRLIDEVDESKWGAIDHLGTSINWQVGHIIISKYFHSIQTVLGSENEITRAIKQIIPTADYNKYYGKDSNPLVEWSGRPDKSQLLNAKNELDQATNRVLESLTEADLVNETEVENPVAKIKYDALTFTFKHQMWHNGQIAMMKRIIAKQTI